MKLSQLEAFLAVAEKQSFSEAALQLNLSQAAISYAIAELEKELESRLLERGRFGARSTEFGKQVAIQARAILQHRNAIKQQATAAKGMLAGILKVATFRSAAGKLLPPVMASVQKNYPHLQIQLLEVEDFDSQNRSKEQILRDRMADLAFIENPPSNKESPADLMSFEVIRDSYKAIVPADDPRTIVNWQDIKQESFIVPSCIFCHEIIRQKIPDGDFISKANYYVKEDSTILRMISQNLGMSVLPELAIDELPPNTKILDMNEPLERIIALAVLPSMLKVPAIRIFLQELKKQFPSSAIPDFDLAKAS